MRVRINEDIINIPSSLHDFKLSDRIRYHKEYGAAYEKKLQELLAIEDELIKEVELSILQFDNVLNTFSFFSGIERKVLEDSSHVNEIVAIFYQSLKGLIEEQEDISFQEEYYWNNEVWEIHPPYLNSASKMKFGELIDGKQILKEMIEFGNGKWEAMPYLCAIYFRKKGEEYNKEFTQEGSDRLKMMYDLPMDYVLAVGFFLSSSLNGYMNTSHYSENQKLIEKVLTQKITSQNGVG